MCGCGCGYSGREITAKSVINVIVKAHNGNAANKAHATRRLNAYLFQEEFNGKNPKQVKAAIKAHVTRRLNADCLNAIK
jgi:hypothetical protein